MLLLLVIRKRIGWNWDGRQWDAIFRERPRRKGKGGCRGKSHPQQNQQPPTDWSSPDCLHIISETKGSPLTVNERDTARLSSNWWVVRITMALHASWRHNSIVVSPQKLSQNGDLRRFALMFSWNTAVSVSWWCWFLLSMMMACFKSIFVFGLGFYDVDWLSECRYVFFGDL